MKHVFSRQGRVVTLLARCGAVAGLLLALADAAWATTAGPPVTVPEPASLAVLAVGAGALLIARARRK